MALLYKTFMVARTVFYAAFAGFLLAGLPAAAQDLFTVEGVKVDVTAENALAARDQAFARAQQEAFKALARRMLSETGAQSVAVPEPLAISAMIQDYEVTQEKLSAVRYIGTYTFRFRDSAVRRYFENANVAYTDVPGRPVLILPFYQDGARAVLWSPYNPWIQAWNRAGDLGGIVPVLVPLGDLEDVKDIGEDDVFTYEPGGLDRILQRYEATEAVLAVAVPDANLAAMKDDAAQATGALAVNIYRTDQGEPEKVEQVVFSPIGQSRAQMLDEAVKKVHAVLQSDWKRRTMSAAPLAQKAMMQTRLVIGGLDEWSRARAVLERVSGIDEIILRSLSPRQARVDLVYRGEESRLRLALEQAGITLSAPQFAPASYGAPAMPPVYDMTLGASRPAPAAMPAYVPDPAYGQPGPGRQNDVVPPPAHVQGQAPGYVGRF